jgi:hypothetical protein
MIHVIAHDSHDGPHPWEPSCALAYLGLESER